MEIRVYDREMNFMGISENQTSLTWTRRYFESGEFTLYAPLTDYNLSLYKLDNLVTYRGAGEAGVIEDLTLRSTSTERIIIASGRFLTSYLDRRLIRPRLNFSGTVETAMRQIITDAVPIPRVVMGDFHDFPETVEFQASYKEILKTETALSKSSNIGFKMRPDFTEKLIYFETYKGVDRSRRQKERSFIEFSDTFNNLNSVENRKNNQLLKNVGYVGGEGEGDERVWVTVGNDGLEGLDRREVLIDARDLTSTDLTEDEYLAVLMTRGYERLGEQILSDSYESETIPQGNFRYKVDYDLGDIVTVRKNGWGLDQDSRITEIQEVYENGAAKIVPIFGNPLPTTLNLEDNV